MSTPDNDDRLGLERFDGVDVPHQWDDIVRRTEADGAGSNVVAIRRNRWWYGAAAASVVVLIGGLVVVTQLRNDDGTTPIDQPSDQPSTDAADMTPCGDDSDLDAIVELLSSGLPTYDYQPAANMGELVGRNDLVVRAELAQAVRGAGSAPADLGDLGLTTVSLGSVSVLSGDSSKTVGGFDTASQWAVRSEADPLAEPVTFEGLEVLAVLSERDDVPSGWTPDIEGWFVACDGAQAVGVIETPTFLDLSSLDALEAQITGVETGTTTSTDPPTIESVPPTTVPTAPTVTSPAVDVTVPESAVDERWTPTCVDRFGDGDAPSADNGLDEFGPLGAVPGLDIVLPSFQSNDQAAPAAVNVAVGRVDGGAAVLARPYEGEDTNTYILSVVDDDGSVRWRRCVDGAFGGSMLVSPGADLIAIEEYTPVTGMDAPEWQTFDVASGRDAAPLGIPDELHTVTAAGRFALFSLNDERLVTSDAEMRLLDLATGGLTTIPYPDVTDVTDVVAFHFELVDPLVADVADVRILQRNFDSDPFTVENVWADGAWRDDDATILGATPVRAVNTADERGWEGRNGLGEVVWSRPDLLDIRQEGFLSDVSGTVTIINGCLEQAEGGCGRGSLFGIDTASGDTLWERAGLRGVSAAGDGYAIITNDSIDGWEMIDTLTGELVDESQQWAGIEPFAQECCGAGDFVWVGRDGGVVFAVDQDHIRVWYPQGRSDSTIAVSLDE